MTLVITGKDFWQSSPYAKRIPPKTKVGIVHTRLPEMMLECNTCGHAEKIIIDEQDGHWGWGRCSYCDKRYLIDFI